MTYTPPLNDMKFALRYLSGFDAQQVVADIASYSPAAQLLTIDYDDAEQAASASLFG